jgi:hypothetical protein
MEIQQSNRADNQAPVSSRSYANNVALYTWLWLTAIYLILGGIGPSDPVSALVGLFAPSAFWITVLSHGIVPLFIFIIILYVDRKMRTWNLSLPLKILIALIFLFLATSIVDNIYTGHYISLEIFQNELLNGELGGNYYWN